MKYQQTFELQGLWDVVPTLSMSQVHSLRAQNCKDCPMAQ